MTSIDVSGRPFPDVTGLSEPFWTGGETGRLMVQRCASCAHLVHPPTIRCPHDRSPDLAWEATSGTGTIESWTVNLHSWFPGFDAPYVVALVALDDDPTVRVLANLVDIEPDAVRADLPVEVLFAPLVAPDDPDDKVWLPFFRPRAGADLGVRSDR